MYHNIWTYFATLYALHCVHFRTKLVQKIFWAKLGIELTATRGSTDRCFDHSATELVVNLQGSLEFYTNPKIRSHSSGSHGPLNEFEQVPLL